jgi:two-component system response regulator FixJ
MRILLVDDEPDLLCSLQRSFRRIKPEWELASACSGKAALEQLQDRTFDFLVTDVCMPGLGGMALLSQVRADPRLANLPVILITARDDRESLRAGMTAGADDFLPKPFTPLELLAAITARATRNQLRPAPTPETLAAWERLTQLLTQREVQVLTHIGQGRVTKEIAAELGISPRTVDVHRANLMRKLHVHTASGLARLAIQAQLA